MEPEIILIIAILGTIKVSKQDLPNFLFPRRTGQSSSVEITGDRLLFFNPDSSELHNSNQIPENETRRFRPEFIQNGRKLQKELIRICNNKHQDCQCDNEVCKIYFNKNDNNGVKKRTLKNSFPIYKQELIKFNLDDSQEILEDLVRKINTKYHQNNRNSIIVDTLEYLSSKQRQRSSTERYQKNLAKYTFDNSLGDDILTILSDKKHNKHVDMKKITNSIVANSLLRHINPNYFRRYHTSLLGSMGKGKRKDKDKDKGIGKDKEKDKGKEEKPKNTEKPNIDKDTGNKPDGNFHVDKEVEEDAIKKEEVGKGDVDKNEGKEGVDFDNNKSKSKEINKSSPDKIGGTNKPTNDNPKKEENESDSEDDEEENSRDESTDREESDDDQEKNTPENDFVQNEKLSPQDLYDFYQTAKQSVIDSALLYVRNKNSKLPDIQFLKSDYIERLKKLKKKHQRRRIKNRRLKRLISNILFKRETSVKIRQHLKNNDGVYLPLWMFKSVKKWKNNYANYKKKHSLSFKHPKTV